jgi:hypothetical protein
LMKFSHLCETHHYDYGGCLIAVIVDKDSSALVYH